MKKLSIALIVVLAMTVMAAGLAAAMGHVVAGKVTAVDAKAGTVTVQTDKGDVTVSVAAADMGDIKVGSKVTMETTEKNGKKTATKVEVKKRKAVVGC